MADIVKNRQSILRVPKSDCGPINDCFKQDSSMNWCENTSLDSVAFQPFEGPLTVMGILASLAALVILGSWVFFAKPDRNIAHGRGRPFFATGSSVLQVQGNCTRTDADLIILRLSNHTLGKILRSLKKDVKWFAVMSGCATFSSHD